MPSRSQIARLVAQIEALVSTTAKQLVLVDPRVETLAPKSGRVVYVWRNRGETAEEVLERRYLTSPAERFAGQTYILSWLEN